MILVQQKNNFAALSLILLAPLLILQSDSSVCIAKPQIKLEKLYPKLDKLPPPLLLKTGIGTNVALPANINDFGYVQNSNSFPSKITFVDPRSNAFSSGLQPNDKLLSASFDTKGATLVVERKGKKYLCQISAYKPKVAPLTKLPKKNSTLPLDKYEIVLLVDSSASMNTKDCPDGKSRWQWCRAQAGNLLSEKILAGKTTITLFSSNYSSHARCSLNDLPRVFENNSASGETNLAPPLKDALTSLSSQLYSGRPAMIAIVTDGRPTDVDKVRKLLIETANNLKDPGLLNITFIEIGTPEKYLKEFDTDLVKQGAKADIVSLYPFSEVNSKGLVKTLAQSAKPPEISTPAVGQAIKPTENQLKIQASIKALEEKRLQQEARSKVLQQAANKRYDFSQTKMAKTKAPNAVSISKPLAIKAHPTGMSQNLSQAEVNERESLLKEGANKTYSLPGSGTK